MSRVFDIVKALTQFVRDFVYFFLISTSLAFDMRLDHELGYQNVTFSPMLPVVGVGVVAVGLGGGTLYFKRNRSSPFFKKALVAIGVEEPSFQVLVTVHQIRNIARKNRTYVRILCPFPDDPSGQKYARRTTTSGEGSWQEGLTIKIPQGCEKMIFEIMRCGNLYDTKLGTSELRISLIGDMKYPSHKWFPIKARSRENLAAEIKLSFMRICMNEEPKEQYSEIFQANQFSHGLQQHMETVLKNPSVQERSSVVSKLSPDLQRLHLLATMCSGELLRCNTFGKYTPVYFDLICRNEAKLEWELAFWQSKEDRTQNVDNPLESISALHVTGIKSHPGNRHVFTLHHRSAKTGVSKTTYEWQFKRVDLDRDIWVEALSNFVLALRSVYRDKRQAQRSQKAKSDNSFIHSGTTTFATTEETRSS